MQKNVPVQIKYQALNEKYSISMINYLTEFKRACDLSRIHEGTAVWLFWELVNGPTLASMKVRLTLSTNNSDRHDDTITIYAEVVYHLLRRYTIDAIIVKADEESRCFEQGSLKPCNFSQKI